MNIQKRQSPYEHPSHQRQTSTGWLGIVRLGLVQASLGAIVVLTTSTLNRVMVVEYAFPAILPGSLVALHYLVQLLRPRMGYGSDMGGRRTPWIIGGMALLAAGGTAAAAATALMATNRTLGIVLAVPAFAAVGAGVGAAGTSVLTLMAQQVSARRRAPAATILWLLMIVGIAISAIAASKLLDPFAPARLLKVVFGIDGAALTLSIMAVIGIERPPPAPAPLSLQPQSTAKVSFGTALREIWAEPQSRRFALFVFISMLAYSAQELILEPYAGSVFGLTPGQSARITGLQHGGVLVGMLIVAIAAGAAGEFRTRAMRGWTIGGCAASALALAILGAGGLAGPAFPLRTAVFLLGTANGAFTVSAIGAMMGLAVQGQSRREGVRMGLWGAAQAVAFGAGGLAGTGASDAARHLLGTPSIAYAAVFTAEAILFLAAARLAAGIFSPQAGHTDRKRLPPAPPRTPSPPPPDQEKRHGPATDFRCRGRRRRPRRRHGRKRPGQRQPLRPPARPRRPHQTLRRRHPPAPHPRLRHPRQPARRPGPRRTHDRPLLQGSGHADRRRLRRHG